MNKGTIDLISANPGPKTGSIGIEDTDPKKQIPFTDQDFGNEIGQGTRVSFEIENPGPDQKAINIKKITQVTIDGNIPVTGDAKLALKALVDALDIHPIKIELEQDASKVQIGQRVKTSCEGTERGTLTDVQLAHWKDLGVGVAELAVTSNNGSDIRIKIEHEL